MKSLVLVSAAMMFAATGFAQERFDVFGNYSYLQFNPTVDGVQSRAFNGGGGGAQVNFGRFFGIKGEFEGYGSTQLTYTVASPIVTPHGTVPAGTFSSNFNQFTYLFGPVVGVHAKKIYVYGEFLMGQSNTNGYAQLAKSVDAGGGTVDAGGTQHPFTYAFGGGLDYNVSKHVGLRLAQMDWVLTRFTNPFTNTNNQHSFRYQAGIVFRFGGGQ